jgi:predicted transcriptional regulator
VVLVANMSLDRSQEVPVNRVLNMHIDEVLEFAKALSTQLRVDMFMQLLKHPMNVGEIADHFDLPVSTAAVNLKKLEEAGLILTELVPGTRGTQKLCAAVISRIVIEAADRPEEHEHVIEIPMPIGQFVDCSITPTCGIVSATGIIGELDDPSCFYDPQRGQAQLLWFRTGFVEYRFPNRVPPQDELHSLELVMEICSEAPLYNPNWPSDITLWVNQVEVGTWTSSGDFGGEPGYLTPEWWGTHQTQFGQLKTWRISDKGSYVDGKQISDVTLKDINLHNSNFVSVRLGVKPDAVRVGGMNLFGRQFGNYETDLLMRIISATPSHQRSGHRAEAGAQGDCEDG